MYQNRTQFVAISKEAEKLKSEMRTLRGLISELTSSLGSATLGAAAPEPRTSNDSGAARARKQANRSSVANLESMWNAQLYALWKSVEGSQKFLPAIPGRHVVHETGHWVELDAATWKARRPAHIFLLNDQLLIATKKKRRVDPNTVNGNAPQETTTKIVADKCWPLQDIDISDLSSTTAGSSGDRNEMINAISIRHGKESFTYRIDKDSGAEKANLLLAFRRATDELRRTLKAETEEISSKSKESMDYLAASNPASAPEAEVERVHDRPEVLIEVDGKHQNMRWVEGQIDELDSEVALQAFEDAVRHVEKLRRIAKGLKSNAIARELITTKVDARASKLAGELSETNLTACTKLTANRFGSTASNRHSFPTNSYTNQRGMAGSARLRRTCKRIVFESSNSNHCSTSTPLRFRRRFTSLHLPIVVCLFHTHQTHGQHIPAMFPTADDECLCQVGQGTAR